MARSTRSAATERAYHHFAPSSTRTGYQAPAAGPFDEFDESDVWGSFNPAEEAEQPSARAAAAELPRVRSTVPPARPGRRGAAAAHGSLPMAIPDWSKILGDEYQAAHQAEWELDDGDDEVVVEGAPVVPPHELAWRRRAASLSVNDGMGIGRMLKVRDAVWKKTGFQA